MYGTNIKKTWGVLSKHITFPQPKFRPTTQTQIYTAPQILQSRIFIFKNITSIEIKSALYD
jgi:hypothetical protein